MNLLTLLTSPFQRINTVNTINIRTPSYIDEPAIIHSNSYIIKEEWFEMTDLSQDIQEDQKVTQELPLEIYDESKLIELDDIQDDELDDIQDDELDDVVMRLLLDLL